MQDLVLDYGMEAYGLYWYVVEQIAYGVDGNNFTFDLKSDSRIIAKDTGMQRQKVEDIISYMVSIGLFQESNNAIYCFKLLDRMDSSQTSNKKFRLMIQQAKEGRDKGVSVILKNNHDSIMTESCLSHELEVEVEVDIEEKNKELIVSEKSPTKKYNYSDGDLKFAKSMYEKILEVNAATKKPNLEQWASDCRVMKSREGIPLNEYWRVFLWANNNDFWKDQIRSPANLRKHYPQLFGKIQSQQPNPRESVKPVNAKLSPSERFRQSLIAKGKKPTF